MSSVQRWAHEHPTECVQVRYEYGSWVRYEDHERAVAEAVAAEREACAQTVDALYASAGNYAQDMVDPADVAAAIRARGQA